MAQKQKKIKEKVKTRGACSLGCRYWWRFACHWVLSGCNFIFRCHGL